METELNEQPANQSGGTQTIAPPVEGHAGAVARHHQHVSPATCSSCAAAAESNGNSAAGNVQRPDDTNCGLRSNLFF